jgi:hypothetical protein
MWIVQTPSRFYGPFKTAQAAAKWGRAELPYCMWGIFYLGRP